MYSQDIRDKLEEKDIELGDLITVSGREGRLMPKPESGDSDVVVLKDESGYNLGLEPENLELLEKMDGIEESNGLEPSYSDDKPDILFLHTGGTISSRVSYEEGGVDPSAHEVEDMVEMYPELAEEVNIHSEVIAEMLSEDMEPEHWQQIAETIHELKDEYDGIVVGHGTDTMSYTGAALSLMLKGIDTGVLLVGSQRSSDRPSSDASMNLRCASKFLKETDFQGIGICMHQNSEDLACNILPPQKVRKMHTSRRDAFEPVNTDLLGTVNMETGEIRENYEDSQEDYRFEPGFNQDVGWLRVRPGMKPEELDFILEQDYQGLVVEGTGLGHMPVNDFDDNTQHHAEILDKLDEIAEDTLVVMTSQCLNGRVDMDVYSAGHKIQEAGVIGAGDMHPELAYVKLMWSISRAEDLEEAEQIFSKDYSGELEKRSVYSD
jgi:glutamyl-tRNA(Gln) amidotransferase subunit D